MRVWWLVRFYELVMNEAYFGADVGGIFFGRTSTETPKHDEAPSWAGSASFYDLESDVPEAPSESGDWPEVELAIAGAEKSLIANADKSLTANADKKSESDFESQSEVV